jgi:hypothetical protein
MNLFNRFWTAGVFAAMASLASPLSTHLLGDLPLRFEDNHDGASHDGVSEVGAEFLARGPNYRLRLTTKESWLDWTDPAAGNTGRLRTRFLNSQAQTRMEACDPLPGSVNYLVGNPEKWRTDVAGYGSIRYRQIYPGVDLVFHGEQGRLEYDFILQPLANPDVIRLELSGQRDVYIDANGDLVAVMSAGEIRWKRPVAYQDFSGGRHLVEGHFALNGKGMVGLPSATTITAWPSSSIPLSAT